MSFRLKTILGIALIESILLILLIFSGMNFFSNANETHLKRRAETTSILVSKAVKDAVISTDLATLESFMEDILMLPDIVYIRIRNNNFILAEGGAPKDLNRLHTPDHNLSNVSDGIFDINIDVTEGETSYGKVEIGLSTISIEKDIENAQHWAIVIASIEVLLVAIFSFILGTFLTRRLLKLKRASEAITLSGPGHQIKVTGEDEISDVIIAFNSMSSTLSESYKKLSQSIDAEREMSTSAKQNQAQNDAILTASLDALISIDQHGVVVDYNKVAEQIFGWKYDEVFGKNLSDFIIPPHKRKAHHAGMKSFLITKDSPVINKRLELTAQHKLGHTFPIEINIAPIETEQGISFTAFIRDITSRLEAETELRLAAQTFESTEAMFISDSDGNIIRINKAFTGITGYTDDHVIGKKPSILSSGRHTSEFYKSMWATLALHGKWSGEIYNKRMNGEIYPEYLNISSVKDKNDKVTHYIAHFMDITEQKNNEENLRKARHEAEASNESKSLFLASMSHEIRTPMNAVLGILSLLKDTTLTEKQLTLISTAEDSGELLMTIINDILDFTKMDVNEQVLQVSEFDLHLLLKNCISLLKLLAEKKSLQLSLEQSPKLPQFVKGDPDRIKQILINLINNAIKFTKEGCIKVAATLESQEHENELLLRFQIIDTGIGIHKENQEALFDEFTMVDQTHSRKYEGTGLGLAICKRLVKLMSGHIQIESEVGKGSTFEFTLKLEKADESLVQKTLLKDVVYTPRENTRILLAEDNLPNQLVIKSILEFSNQQVDVVNNGYEAIQAVQNKDYEIILMDISMPEMDGMTATKEIRKLTKPICNIPIIALTAHTLNGDKKRFLEAGMNDYLSKPIDRVAILSSIAKWTKREESQPSKQQDSENFLNEEVKVIKDEGLYVDEEALIQLVEDTDDKIVPELIKLYIEDSKQRMDKVNVAIKEQDFEKLEFETHTIGSSAVAHGNTKLYNLARKIEMLCREGEQQQALKHAYRINEIAQKSFNLLSTRADKGFK